MTWSSADSRQTVELRSPDGCALVHLLLAGIVMAADWAFRDAPGILGDSSPLELAERELYERDGIFPPNVIDYVARILRAENDETMNQRLFDLPADDRLLETRKIMHKDLHRH